MEFTVTIKDKELDSILSEVIDHRLHGNFKTESLKKAGVPTVKEVAKLLLQDTKFMKKLIKRVTDNLNSEATESLLNELYDSEIPLIDKYADRAEDIETNDKEVQAIVKATNLLKSKGYDVKKNNKG